MMKKSGVLTIHLVNDFVSNWKIKDDEMVQRFRVYHQEVSLEVKKLVIVNKNLTRLLSSTQQKNRLSRRKRKTLKNHAEVSTVAE